jgi:hypothetical protein
MMTTYANSPVATPASLLQSSWWERFRQQGYAFRWFAIATIVTGIYLHVTRLLIGDTLLQQYILSPLFDQYFALPIAYSGITGLLSWRRMAFRSRRHKIFLGVIVFYMIASIPLHLSVWFTHSVEHLKQFPLWFSLALQPYYAAVLIALWRVQFKANAQESIVMSKSSALTADIV